MGKQKPWSCVCLPDPWWCVCAFFFFFSPSLFWNKCCDLKVTPALFPVLRGSQGCYYFLHAKQLQPPSPAPGLRAGRQDVFLEADLAWQGSRENFLSLLRILH